MSILVTGGAGFIGTNFILDWFKFTDELVINVDKLTYAGNNSNLKSLSGSAKYKFNQTDICDGEKFLNILRQFRPRAIINFAAESHVDRSITGPSTFIQTNIIGTFNMLEAARTYTGELSNQSRDAFRFIHVSTDEVYGTLNKDDEPFTEGTPYAPNSPYSASKASSDHLARAYFYTYGLPTIITNCSNNYGPFQFPEKLIPLIILRALNDDPLPIYGDGTQIRDWLFVSDHCSAIRSVLAKGTPGMVYNIGGNCEMPNIDVVKNICSILDETQPIPSGDRYQDRIEHVADRPGHDWRYAINCEKIKLELGWEPRTDFAEGIRKTVGWYMQNADWLKTVTRYKSTESDFVVK